MDTVKIGLGGKVSGLEIANKKQRDLKKACKDFEAVFTYQLLRTMRQTVEKCDLFHGGKGEEIYESMFDMELSKRMAGLGRNSLSDLLYDQLSKRLPTDSPVTEDRKTEDSGQTSAGKTDIGRWSEISGNKTGGQRSEVRDQQMQTASPQKTADNGE